MRQKNHLYNSLKCSGFLCNIGPISRSNDGVLSPALLNDFSRYSDGKGTDWHPSLLDIPKRNLDFILHYLLLQQINNSKLPSSSSFSYRCHRYFLFQYHKNFQLVRRLKGTALCLLKTQYAKKKRNPE